nr:hypothetical protein [Tanacetum cinerariifolium]
KSLREDSDGLFPGLMRRDFKSLFGRMDSLSRRLCGREMTHALVEKKGNAKDEYYGKLILDLGNEVRSSIKQETAAMENLVERLGNTKEKAECKKLKKELKESRFSNTFICMQNERVERDLYWTRVRAHEFYQDMIRRGFVFEERPNKAIDVLIKDEKISRISAIGCNDLYHFMKQCKIMPPKSTPLTQAAIRQMIKESVDAPIAAERARHTNARNDARGSGPVKGQDVAPAVRECTFAGFIKCNPTACHGTEGAVELRRWFEKTESVFGISERTTRVLSNRKSSKNEARTVKLEERVKVDAYIRRLTDNIKGEVTSSKPANLNEAMRMAYKLMEPKSQARDERILEGRNQNAPTDGRVSSGSLPLCERCFTHHVSPCTIKCHKCGKVGHKARYCKEKSVAMGANAQPIPTCYDCGEQGHTRNRCPKKVKQEEVRKVCGRAYAIKDADPQGSNVVTSTFMLNNRYASILFDSGSDRSFVDTRFSSMLNIDKNKS